ncbi:MAG: phosphoglycerate mutase family protein [Bacilli bacterium]|nr:phosphoglycerate mutase family protein [Bacilli bacterium]
MTQFCFIRHGQPDYSYLKNAESQIESEALAFLTNIGIEQAKKAAEDPRIEGADILIASPYTRTMQTAAIVAGQLGLQVYGEMDLHEWNAKTDNEKLTLKERIKRYIQEQEKFDLGIDNEEEYESLYSVQCRVLKVLRKYLEYKKVIVVTHAGVIYSQTQENCHYCDIVTKEYHFYEANKNLPKRPRSLSLPRK